MSLSDYNKIFLLTIDIEEWYHLEYLREYKLNRDISVKRGFVDLLSALDENSIKATFFVVSELLDKFKDVFHDINLNNYEIASHSHKHYLPLKMKLNDFYEDAYKSKNLLENYFNREIKGFRAPCFSLDESCLDQLIKIGFQYDSSLINSSANQYYGNLNLQNFNKMKDNIFKYKDLYEIQIPTWDFFRYKIPISGTGYQRIFPNFLLKRILLNQIKDKKNYLFYTHPYEFFEDRIKLPKNLGYMNKFRFNIGKKDFLSKFINNLKKIREQGFIFMTIYDYLNTLK